jgi:HSP20 family protein
MDWQVELPGMLFVAEIRCNQQKENKMNILKHKNILKDLGQQIDLINTLGGGVSMAQMQIQNKKDRLELRVFAPTVAPEAMQVVVDHNRLSIAGVLPASNGSDIKMPLFHQVFEIPFQVDVARIGARFEAGQLKVIMPYTEGQTNTPRLIDIEV